MDVVRSPQKNRNLKRNAAIGAAAVIVAATTLGLSRLQTAAPEVDRNSVVIDTVKRGALQREVRASGVLTPEDVRWISTATDARVERIVVQPGTVVTADTIIIELSNEQQQQTARDAEFQLRAARADVETMRAQLESERLDREASLARLRAEYQQARLRADADAQLEHEGLVPHITKAVSQSSAEELARRVKIEEERVRVSQSSQQSRLAAASAAVDQRLSLFELQSQQTKALAVRAGIDGVLQQVTVQAGQRVNAGTTIARVARPDRLKAEVRVAETQAKDVAVGQHAEIDTRNGVVPATVSRIDPSVREGTVTVDLRIDGPLPPGARPDLSIDGTITLERIPETLSISRPVSAQEGGSGHVFKVADGGSSATRVNVTYGRASATSIEIRSGLAAGDQVIVSDTSQYDSSDRLRLK